MFSSLDIVDVVNYANFYGLMHLSIGKLGVQKITGTLALWIPPRVSKSLWVCSSEKGNCNGEGKYEIWKDTVKNRWLYQVRIEGRGRETR